MMQFLVVFDSLSIFLPRYDNYEIFGVNDGREELKNCKKTWKINYQAMEGILDAIKNLSYVQDTYTFDSSI
jgi:hypothetical protein